MGIQCMKTTFLLIVAFLTIVFPLATAVIHFSGTSAGLANAAPMGQQAVTVSSEPVQGTNNSVGPCFGMYCALQTETPAATGG
jgi:hypothetical protein